MSTVETGTEVTLASYTTLRLGGPAKAFAVVDNVEDLVDTVYAADRAGERLLLLGGGSNLVVADAGFDGTVLRIATSGWTVEREQAGELLVEVAAGENWDSFVAAMVEQGIGGVECLSGIPGSVGATPIQNVGAYGCEISDVVESVRCYDRATGATYPMTAADLGFAYRTSVLKGTDAGVVLSVRFRLRADGLSQPIRYAELARTLDVEVGARVPAAEARAAVLGLRAGKGMVLDAADHDTWSAGSFFTNPIIGEPEVAGVLARIGEVVGADVAVPQYPADGGVKLSAAWLIERAGFVKGHQGPGGRVSLSHKHTLALTNRGTAATADLLALAREVRDGVRTRFGVELHPEPLLIDCAL
ncbi:UDP-N-acetylmuramate dehydrogenase [Amycolatopsis palatopharyngis]|uniref:UDP-N-acetylmuramate dehydrogenase n=1 Tax=Amycolatopsis palatopharyngis TaxID=187982 RepID=UPI000E23E43A|nr:UDP-N-acetylmuramate dehydrogenase [Amycolatopsis palatopharyngis]